MSTTPCRSTRKKSRPIKTELSRIEYEEYAQMLRDASECYERNQRKRVAERKEKAEALQVKTFTDNLLDV